MSAAVDEGDAAPNHIVRQFLIINQDDDEDAPMVYVRHRRLVKSAATDIESLTSDLFAQATKSLEYEPRNGQSSLRVGGESERFR